MKVSLAKKSLGVAVISAVLLAPGIARADYPPIPTDLGRRVDTPVLVPSAIATRAAIAVKSGSVAVVAEPSPNLRTLTIRAVNVRTGRVTTRTITIPSSSESVAPSLKLAAGQYRVRVVGTLKSGRRVSWNAGTVVARQSKKR